MVKITHHELHFWLINRKTETLDSVFFLRRVPCCPSLKGPPVCFVVSDPLPPFCVTNTRTRRGDRQPWQQTGRDPALCRPGPPLYGVLRPERHRFPVEHNSSLVSFHGALTRRRSLDFSAIFLLCRAEVYSGGPWHCSVYHTVNVIKSKSCQYLLAKGGGSLSLCSSNSPPSG